MKNIYLLFGLLLFVTACDNDLDQIPPNIASADSLTDFEGVLFAAYFYQHGAATPMAVMGDFRGDNAVMEEEPFPAFDRFNSDLTDMEDQFFGPFYTAMYRSISSANTVINNSEEVTDVAEARFLRAISYYKLVLMFGDVTVRLGGEDEALERQPANDIYTNIIIPDLQEAVAVLDADRRSDGRATRFAAQGYLAKVFMTRGDFASAETQLAAIVNGAAGAGFALQENFSDIFGELNDLNPEIIYAQQISSSISDEYGFSEFWSWSGGLDTKSLLPLDPSLIAAFDAVANDTLIGGDLRRAVTIDEAVMASPKFPQTGGPDHDWIELRLADVLLLYAEALNENGAAPDVALGILDPVRTRAGLVPLDPVTLNTQALVRQAIADERRLELAFEGQRWFDLVRTGTADAAFGETINSNFLVAPIPISEVLVTNGVITQNPGY